MGFYERENMVGSVHEMAPLEAWPSSSPEIRVESLRVTVFMTSAAVQDNGYFVSINHGALVRINEL